MSSASTGLDWALVPLQWVTLFLDPRPLLDDGRGLIEVFPWVALGIVGLAPFVIVPIRKADRLAHATIASAIVLHVLVYLAYRDLHPNVLFVFANYHYFKWIYPFFALYGLLLVHAAICERGQRAKIIGLAVFAGCVLLALACGVTCGRPSPEELG